MKKIMIQTITVVARFVKKRVFRQPLRSEQKSSNYITPGGLPVIDREEAVSA